MLLLGVEPTISMRDKGLVENRGSSLIRYVIENKERSSLTLKRSHSQPHDLHEAERFSWKLGGVEFVCLWRNCSLYVASC